MKRMIRILMIAICCMLTCNMAANAGNDKPITVNALPVKAHSLRKRLRVYTIVAFSFVRTFAP